MECYLKVLVFQFLELQADIFNKKRKYKNYPMYSIKFDSFMLASKDSKTCLSRKTCDPIGGNSVWGSFSRMISPNDGKKIIFVTAQLDGNSLFHENTVGTNSQIGGIVANLAIADALSRSNIKPDQFQNHIIFMFFNGESYGYGGSQRFVNDISKTFQCINSENHNNEKYSKDASCYNPYMYFDDFKNITLNNIKGIIELNQLTCSGCNDRNNPVYFMHVDDEKDQETLKIVNLISKVYSIYGGISHVDPVTNNNTDNNTDINNMNKINDAKTDSNINKMNNNGKGNTNNKDNIDNKINKNKLKRQETISYNIKPAWEGIPKNLGLPPASSQSFLKVQKIPAVVISDFQTEFTNRYYHSGFDIDSNTTVYDNTVNNLMYCLSHNISCPLAQTLLTSNDFTRQVEGTLSKVSHYSGVFNDYSLNGTLHTYSNFDSWITNYALIKSTGRNTTFPCKHIHDCMKKFEYPDYDNLDGDSKKRIESMPYSKRKYQCIDHFCIEGQAFVHPAYGTGISYDVTKNQFYVTKENEPTWTESKWSTNSITICFTTSRTFQMFELFVGIVCVVLTVIDHCDPIGGNSIWGTFSKQISPDDGKKIVIVSSQIDGNSLFHDNTIGTNSQIGGFVANLAIADALSKSKILPEQFENHIIFTFFSGESYGYGGSQRFVKDISTYKCKSHEYNKNFMCSEFSSCQDPCMYVDDFKNITLNNIKGIIELNQLTCSGCNDINNPTYYMHVDDETDLETLKITNLISKVSSVFGDIVPSENKVDENTNSKRINSSSYNIKPAWEGLNKNLGLPPASAQSFLKQKRIPAVVIGDFQTEFTNKHYHSGFDVENDSVKYDNTYPNYQNLDKDTKTKIDSLPYSLRKYQCILGYCIEGRAYAHPAYGIGIEHNAQDDKFYVTDKNLPNWTESRIIDWSIMCNTNNHRLLLY
ncbi:hypothetical protein PIROE2DRAFT_69514 [Piromyces sp. E2]|nr:hypothetical protein PIROE2DRAFT_69514 [Piromyces sp. E2]|eukprot:OUM62378.1 hypothetical protein PIROE2DRAFT_69514 [Piromyces sp. E2]